MIFISFRLQPYTRLPGMCTFIQAFLPQLTECITYVWLCGTIFGSRYLFRISFWLPKAKESYSAKNSDSAKPGHLLESKQARVQVAQKWLEPGWGTVPADLPKCFASFPVWNSIRILESITCKPWGHLIIYPCIADLKAHLRPSSVKISSHNECWKSACQDAEILSYRSSPAIHVVLIEFFAQPFCCPMTHT